MAKINLSNNNMALFMVCEAIAEERKEWYDIKPNENGCYDLNIQINGKEINVERFLNSLYESYKTRVKEHAANLLSLEYDKMLNSINEIQETIRRI